jgi:hypothetical protein
MPIPLFYLRILHRELPNAAQVNVRNCPLREREIMPWTPKDAEGHTHKVTTQELKKLWAKVANEALERTGDEGRAIREANAVISRHAQTGG